MSEKSVHLYVGRTLFDLDNFRARLVGIGADLVRATPVGDDRRPPTTFNDFSEIRSTLANEGSIVADVWWGNESPMAVFIDSSRDPAIVSFHIRALDDRTSEVIVLARSMFAAAARAGAKTILVVALPEPSDDGWDGFVFDGQRYAGPLPFLLGIPSEAAERVERLAEAVASERVDDHIVVAGHDVATAFVALSAADRC